MKRVTIKDLAKKAGVSPTTVSLVLNNKPVRTSEETKQRILTLAAEYNYQPSLAARSLITKSTHIMGLVVPDLENIFFSSLAKHLELACRKAGYTLMIISTNDCYQEDRNAITVLASHEVDGVFLVLSEESYHYHEEVQKLLGDLRYPYVLVDRSLPEYDCNQVYYDDRAGAVAAVQYLLQKGHKKIACIKGPDCLPNASERYQGYCQALKENQIEIEDHYVWTGDFQFESGQRAAAELIKTDVTAVFSSNDMMALGCMHYCNEQGVQIPSDLSIVSYDNVLYRYVIGQDITAISQSIPLMASQAFQLLQEAMANDKQAPKTILLQPQLIEGNSVRSLI